MPPVPVKQLWVTRTDNQPMTRFAGGLADYITIHETANYSPGANAWAHANWMFKSAPYSWHDTVDDIEIWQSIPWHMQGWHAGDGYYGLGNQSSIGLEICVHEGIDQERAYENAAWHVANMRLAGHGRKGIVQHNFWTGKDCPRLMRRNRLWDWFLGRVAHYENGGKVVAETKEEFAHILNRAIMQRNDLIHLASGDFDKLKSAHAVLAEKGLVPKRE